jgi:hypothetical protein
MVNFSLSSGRVLNASNDNDFAIVIELYCAGS